MEIENIPITELVPYEKNPRKNDKAVDVVAKSIKEFGFKVPIILDKNNEIIAGHTRLKAAAKLGLSEVPIIRADELSEAQVKAFRIMDNKSSEKSEWDWDLLIDEFKDLRDLKVEFSLTGFDKDEVEAELKLSEAEMTNLVQERYNIIAVDPPEAVRLKERRGFFCDKFEDYKKIKDYFDDGGRLSVNKLLEMIK